MEIFHTTGALEAFSLVKQSIDFFRLFFSSLAISPDASEQS